MTANGQEKNSECTSVWGFLCVKLYYFAAAVQIIQLVLSDLKNLSDISNAITV